jgi:mercuric ion binding protein
MKNIILISLMLFSFGIFEKADAQVFLKNKEYDTAFIKVSSRCNDCKQRIEKTLAYEKGLKDFNLDLKTHKVFVVFDSQKTTLDKIRVAITKVGYDADHMIADPEAYENLPKCCKKDAKPH